MRDSDFIVLAERALADIERILDAGDADLDCFPAGDGVLEIELAGGDGIVINRHAATQEIWIAARSGGFHFRWDGKAWRDTKDGRELMPVLREVIAGERLKKR
ncbi:MAG: iron donor protein CyaY [Candidatus Accumulibacter sp.]|jgi:CyaY protein|nr:iron donor protein CyaY [Accumulibacter sp.]